MLQTVGPLYFVHQRLWNYFHWIETWRTRPESQALICIRLIIQAVAIWKHNLHFLTIQLSFKCVLSAIMFAIILVIHPSLSFNMSQKLSNLHLYSDILREGLCFQLDSLHRKSVHYILTSRFFVFEGQLWVPFPYGFFIHESLAFWTDLNSIMFWVFIVKFNQCFWLKLYFCRQLTRFFC